MIFKLHQHFDEICQSIKIKGSFARNLALTFSGNAISLALGFAFTPFIARVYGPEIYGIFAFFTAIVNSIVPLSTLQFPSGFVAAKDDNEFYDLLKLTFTVLLLGTGLITIAVVFFEHSVFNFLGEVGLGAYAYMIPVYFLLMGFDNLLVGWNIRLKEFKRSALTKVFSVVFSKGVTLLAGIVRQPVPMGMIGGNLLIYPFESFFKLSARLRSDFRNFRQNHQSSVWKTFNKYRGYPMYITSGMVINNLSTQLPVYFFSLSFPPAHAGYFALAGSLVTMPLSIMINSSTTVFLQKAAETQQNNPGVLGAQVFGLYKKLFLVSLLPLFAFALNSDWIFTLIFGDAWKLSGVFASYIAVGAIFTVPAYPLSVLFRLLFRERLNFLTNISFVVIKTLALWIGAVYYQDIVLSIILYSAASMALCVVNLFFIFRLTGLNTKIIVRDCAIVILVFVVVVILKS
jgi:O-antigen/teichoic acid export membrane protein